MKTGDKKKTLKCEYIHYGRDNVDFRMDKGKTIERNY